MAKRRSPEPFVLALDIGSTASRGDIFDATGAPVGVGRRRTAHAFSTRGDGTVEIDPDQVVEEIDEIVTDLAGAVPEGRIAGVALDTFASSLVGVDGDGHAITPCYTYADSRCGPQVTALRRELDEAAVQQRTGCRLHSSYLAPRLRWLRETDPGTFGRVRRWLSLGEYVYLRLLGVTAAGTTTAAWTGLLDRRTGQWDAELLAAAGIDEEQLSPVRDPDAPLTAADGIKTDAWPGLAEAQWFAPIADGFSSNLGVGASGPGLVAVSAATSGAMRVLVTEPPAELPGGLWCYRVDAARSLVGGAVNDVGRMVSWLTETLRLPETEDLGPRLTEPPAPGPPLVLPYLSGERSTGWAAGARATITDVTAATTADSLFRGAMEGVALSYARIAEQLAAVAGPPRQILASGRVTLDLPDWLSVLADVLDAPVTPVPQKRATLRGTALHALEVLAPDVERTPPATGEPRTPVAEHTAYYRDRAAAYQTAYEALID